jgi:predicted DNA-binding ribbon-helix-helix protein
VLIDGQETTVSLEGAFWDALREIAASRGETVHELTTRIANRKPVNLSGAIREFCLDHYRAGGTVSDATKSWVFLDEGKVA